MLWDTKDLELIKRIRLGADKAEKVIVALKDQEWVQDIVFKVLVKGGGDKSEYNYLLKETIILFVGIARRFPIENQYTLRETLEKTAQRSWGKLVRNSLNRRKKIIATVANDKRLKDSIIAILLKSMNGNDIAGSGPEDVYQNGLLKLYELLETSKYKGVSIRGFLVNICKNLLRNLNKKAEGKKISIDERFHDDGSYDKALELFIHGTLSEKHQRIMEAFYQLSGSCQKILRLRFFAWVRMDNTEIAKEMNLENGQVVSNKISWCRQRWRKLYNN